MAEQKTHWRKIIESEYLAGADLDDGNGRHIEIVLTIADAKKEMVREQGTNKEEQCLILKFRESNRKPMICNVTNAKAISKAVGSEYIEDWPGKQIQIGTEKVKAFGELWDALRVKPYAPKPVQSPGAAPTVIICQECQKPISEHQGVSAAKLASATLTKYGRMLCYDCAQIEKSKLEAGEQVGIEPVELPFP